MKDPWKESGARPMMARNKLGMSCRLCPCPCQSQWSRKMAGPWRGPRLGRMML